jgi:hypothetical protein
MVPLVHQTGVGRVGEPCREAILPVHADHKLLTVRPQCSDNGVGLGLRVLVTRRIIFRQWIAQVKPFTGRGPQYSTALACISE